MMLSIEGRIAHQAFVALVALSTLIFLTAVLHQTPSINATQRLPVPPAEILTSRLANNFGKAYRHRLSIRHSHQAHQHFHAARSINQHRTPTNHSAFPKLIGHSPEHSTPLERNATAGRHPSLGERAKPDETVDLAYYVCKGERHLANMRAARPDPPKWAFGNLAHNGWTVDDGGPPLPRVLYPGALAAMRAKGVDNGRNVERTANLENSFVNSRQEVK
ncbi:MAG: hypothetical protein Q9173_002476, partial [Seirophora scorigena]